MSFSLIDDFNDRRRKQQHETEKIERMASTMTLEMFVAEYSSKRLTKKILQIAKKAEIVILVYTGHAVFMEGAISHGIDLYEEDECFDDMYPEEIEAYNKRKEKKFRGTDFYFDKIGFFNPFKQFTSIEQWDEFLKSAKFRYYKLSYHSWDKLYVCNFDYLAFEYTSGVLENVEALVFKVPEFTETHLNRFRLPSYEQEEEMYNANKNEREISQEDSPFDFWTCDACDGNQDTGCLSSTGSCYR